MANGQYNAALSLFFVSYAGFEPLTNILLKRLRPSIFLPIIMTLWGIVMVTMGLVHNAAGLMAARFFLGVAEAGLFPGVAYYLSCWYKRSEFGIRSAIFFSAAALAGSFGGLLAAAIAQMDGIGGKAGWAWIFILVLCRMEALCCTLTDRTNRKVSPPCSLASPATGLSTTSLTMPSSYPTMIASVCSAASKPMVSPRPNMKSSRWHTFGPLSKTGKLGHLLSSTWDVTVLCMRSRCSCLRSSNNCIPASPAPELICSRCHPTLVSAHTMHWYGHC